MAVCIAMYEIGNWTKVTGCACIGALPNIYTTSLLQPLSLLGLIYEPSWCVFFFHHAYTHMHTHTHTTHTTTHTRHI